MKFILALFLASRAFAFSHVGSTEYSLSYSASTVIFPYTTAQNASGNYFYVSFGVDESSTNSMPWAVWNGQVGTIVTGVQYVASTNDGIYLWQFASPSTITSSNITVTSASGSFAWPAITIDEFSGTAGFTKQGTTGGIGNATGTPTGTSLTVSNLSITAATSVTFSASVAYATGATIQPTGWNVLENISNIKVNVASAWGNLYFGAVGIDPFTWALHTGYGAAVAFEMVVAATPTPTVTPTPTSVPVFAVTNVPTPIWRSQPCSLYALAPVTNWTQVNCSCTVQAGCTVELDISSTALCNWSFTRTTAASIPANVNGATALVGSSYVLPLGYNENLWYKCNCPDTLSETAQPCW